MKVALGIVVGRSEGEISVVSPNATSGLVINASSDADAVSDEELRGWRFI